jgi:hypothetical protein
MSKLKLKKAGFVLGISPKDLQNLVQFGVLRPRRQDRFFVFDSPTLLQAKVGFYLKESLDSSAPLPARITKEIFKDMPVSKRGQARNISMLSRPLRGKKPVRIEVSLQTLAAELEAQISVTESRRNRSKANQRSRWKDEISRTFAEAAEDLKGVAEQEIFGEISSIAPNERSLRRSPSLRPPKKERPKGVVNTSVLVAWIARFNGADFGQLVSSGKL